jgi:glutamine synthetase
MASEIEFYLFGSHHCDRLGAYWDDVLLACVAHDISVFNHGKEDGMEQFEIALSSSPNAVKMARDTCNLKSIISDTATGYDMQADFSAKPFADRPGNGLHIHIHLIDEHGKNVFFKDDATISDALKYSIGGLLEWLSDCMPVFAPHVSSYARFVAKSNAPTTVSWGANNRTVAIRLPQAAHENKHIEHRVSGGDADPTMVMAVMLAAIHYGLQHHCDPGTQIYGDASLPMYHLPILPMTLEEAQLRYTNSQKFMGYFSASDLLPVIGYNPLPL